MKPTTPYLFVLGVIFSAGTASAQEVLDFVPRSDFEALQRRLDSYDQRLASTEHRPASRSFCYPCSSQAGVTFGAETTFLRLYQSEGETPGFNFEAAPRIWLGYTGDQGLGIRARWFDYEARNSANAGQETENIDLNVIDVELTDKFQLGHWKGLFTAGLRYADYEEYNDDEYSAMNDSLGAIVGVEMTRQVNSKLHLFGLARASLQYASDGMDSSDDRRNLFFSTTEIQLGAERTLKEICGGRLFLRGAFEAQSWSGGTIGDGDTEDLGLVGGTIGIGFTR